MNTKYYKRYCSSIEQVENYELALKDDFKGWNCHHRLETHNSDGKRRLADISMKELIALGMYYDRPPKELIFLTELEHKHLHNVGKPSNRKGKHHSEEARKKMSESRKGNQNNKGKHHSDETKRKISEANKGKHHSEESKKKMSEAQKGKHWYNNSEVSVQAKECPEGFVKGRICKLVDGKQVWY